MGGVVMRKEEIVTMINQLPGDEREWIKDNIQPINSKHLSALAKARFLAIYKELTGENYYWTGKDGKVLLSVLTKLKSKMRELREDTDNDEKVVATFEMYARESHRVDKFINTCFTVANLNGQFNSLYNKVKNGTQTNNNNRNSLADYARDLFGGS